VADGSGVSTKPELVIRFEAFKDCWSEGSQLVRAEAKEVEPYGRDFNPDINSIITNEMLGVFRIIVARIDGRLVGYLTFMIDFDLESYGTLIANQTAWYLEPGHFGVAHKMYFFAVEEFKRLGVKFVYWHHTINGRGKSLGKFFERNGAHLMSMTYGQKL
jgi:hypothetical protein